MRKAWLGMVAILVVGGCAAAYAAATLAELRKKAETGDAEAQVQLGDKYAIGAETPRNLPEAV